MLLKFVCDAVVAYYFCVLCCNALSMFHD